MIVRELSSTGLSWERSALLRAAIVRSSFGAKRRAAALIQHRIHQGIAHFGAVRLFRIAQNRVGTRIQDGVGRRRGRRAIRH